MLSRLAAACIVVFALTPFAASAESSGFAVVELFTSEGCSSCPPADETLAAIARMADEEKLPIYPLEWHVDYWDYLGWKDPFDSRLATERQYAYSRSLPSDVYTPQMVINGIVVPAYAGDRSSVEAEARSLLGERAAAALRVQVIRLEPQKARVHVDVSGAPAGTVLLLALTEGGLSATPNAGENAGRRLEHSGVVRAVKVVAPADGDVEITIPRGIDAAKARLIGIIQDERSLRIFAAAQVFFRAQLSGRVVNNAGNGVAGMTVQVCSASVCIPAVSDAAGFFSLAGLNPGSYTITVGALSKEVKVDVRPGQMSTLEPIVLRASDQEPREFSRETPDSR